MVANVSLVTGDPRVTDVFGHGTHVAGIIAGKAAAASAVTTLFNGGIAPGAQLINVRVLGADGIGRTSDVHRRHRMGDRQPARYNIRVINLSLGHPVTEPAAPTRCAKRSPTPPPASSSSFRGRQRRPDGRRPHVLGGITSPGNSPSALTVGALEHLGHGGRSDDTVATYSSRGPTRTTRVKPDVAAPGNKIVSLEANGSYARDGNYPYLHRAGSGNNAYMQLSGTSMAAPMVSGGVALLLQGNAGLSPAQVKIALQSGATYMPTAVDGRAAPAASTSGRRAACRRTHPCSRRSSRCRRR